MAIPKDIRPASYRGVGFEAKEVGFTTGRRLQTHEYDQRDEPYTEDHGRATRRWKLQAFLVRGGDESHADLQARKRKLIEAIETKGAGKLVHPTDGDVGNVRCETCDITESSGGLNYVEFDISFVESGAVFQATTVQKSKASTFASRLKQAIRTAYRIRRAARSAEDKVRRIMSGNIYDQCNALLGLAGQIGGADVTAYQDAVTAIRDAHETLKDDAGELVDRWQAVFDSFSDPSSPRTVVQSLAAPLAASQLAAATGASTARDQAILDNAADTDLMVAVSALAVAGALAADASYTAYDEAIATRDTLAGLLASVALYAADADTYAALLDLQAAVTTAITEEALDLPRIRVLTVPTTRTLLEVAYDLYADPERAMEILDRNKLADPNAVSGPLYLLTV